jgi:hypothetical protein
LPDSPDTFPEDAVEEKLKSDGSKLNEEEFWELIDDDSREREALNEILYLPLPCTREILSH